MSFSSFFRREIHNQQHWLDMSKKSQNGHKAKKILVPKTLQTCHTLQKYFQPVSLRKSVGVLC